MKAAPGARAGGTDHHGEQPPWMSREWAKVLAIALLGYFTLFNRPTKRLLVRVLATIKPLDIRG